MDLSDTKRMADYKDRSDALGVVVQEWVRPHEKFLLESGGRVFNVTRNDDMYSTLSDLCRSPTYLVIRVPEINNSYRGLDVWLYRNDEYTCRTKGICDFGTNHNFSVITNTDGVKCYTFPTSKYRYPTKGAESNVLSVALTAFPDSMPRRSDTVLVKKNDYSKAYILPLPASTLNITTDEYIKWYSCDTIANQIPTALPVPQSLKKQSGTGPKIDELTKMNQNANAQVRALKNNVSDLEIALRTANNALEVATEAGQISEAEVRKADTEAPNDAATKAATEAAKATEAEREKEEEAAKAAEVKRNKIEEAANARIEAAKEKEAKRKKEEEAAKATETKRKKEKETAKAHAEEAEQKKKEEAATAEAERKKGEEAAKAHAEEAERKKEEEAATAKAEREKKEEAAKAAEAERKKEEEAATAKAEREKEEEAAKAAKAAAAKEETAKEAAAKEAAAKEAAAKVATAKAEEAKEAAANVATAKAEEVNKKKAADDKIGADLLAAAALEEAYAKFLDADYNQGAANTVKTPSMGTESHEESKLNEYWGGTEDLYSHNNEINGLDDEYNITGHNNENYGLDDEDE